MPTIGRVNVVGNADISDFSDHMNKAVGILKHLAKEARPAEVQVKKLGGALDGLKFGAGFFSAGAAFGALKSGLGGAVGLIGSAIQAGSDFNETWSKTQAVLGDASGGVKTFADDMANRFGMVKSETLDAASAFGALGKGLGGLKGKALTNFATGFTKLSADLSSFADMDFAEAQHALLVGLSGEQSDQLKRLGVTLLEDEVKAYAYAHGIAAVGTNLNNAQKIAARTGIIFKALKDAQGDLEKTSFGVANATRALSGRIKNLEADAGQALSAISQGTLGGLSLAVARLSKDFAANQTGIKKWADGAVQAGGLVSGAIGLVGTTVGVLVETFQVVRHAWQGLEGMIVFGIGVIAGAFGGLLKPFDMLAEKLTGIQQNLANNVLAFAGEEMTAGLKLLNEGIDGLKNIGGQHAGVTKFFGDIQRGAAAAGKAMASSGGAAKKLAAAAMVAAQAQAKEAQSKAETKANDYIAGLVKEGITFGLTARQIKLYEMAQEGATVAQVKQAMALSTQLDALDEQKKALDELKSAAKSTFESTLTPVEKFGDALVKLRQQFHAGLIDQETLTRGIMKAREESGLFQRRPVAALEHGSAAAYSARLASANEIADAHDTRTRAADLAARIARGGGNAEDAAKATAQNTQEQINYLKMILNALYAQRPVAAMPPAGMVGVN